MTLSKVMNTVEKLFPYARIYYDEDKQCYHIIYQGSHDIFYQDGKIILFSDYINEILYDKLSEHYDLHLLAYFLSLRLGYTKRLFNIVDVKIYEIK